jgi:magnesium transporter
MIRILYRPGTQAGCRELAAAELAQALHDKQGLLWIDIVHNETQRDEVAQLLRETFAFHPLAIDDALNEAHVSRVDDWNEYLYVVLHALQLEVNRTLDILELDCFLGPNYLVTVHTEPVQPLEHLWNNCDRNADPRAVVGADHLFYRLCDLIVAQYMPVVDGLDDEIDDLEDEIFHNRRHGTITRIFQLRRTLLRLRRMLGYLRETTNRLARDPFPVIREQERVYFRDVYDHLVRLFDIADGLRDMAVGALESLMSVTSNRINEVMRTLTVVTVLFLPLNFIVGFFGMNFFGESFNVQDPVAPWVLFFVCVTALTATPPVMLWWMARKGWLRSPLPPDKEDEEKEEDGLRAGRPTK